MAFINGLVVIHPGNEAQFIDGTPHAGENRRTGLVPRDYEKHPVGFYKGITPYHKVDMGLIPQSEWAGLIQRKTREKSWLSDLRDIGMNGKPIPSRDQNGKGYCWAHSGVSAQLLVRARDNQPYADLSAYSVACIIKNFRDEGGWGAQGVDFMREYGCATSKTWKQQSMSRANVNDAMRAEALKYRIDEGWIDLQAAQYDRNLTWAQVVTCLLNDQPVIVDYNWWGHSVCAAALVNGAALFGTFRGESGKLLDLQQFETVWDMNDPVTAGIGALIWNSWGDSWSQNGMGVLSPQKSVPNGSVALRTVYASAMNAAANNALAA